VLAIRSQPPLVVRPEASPPRADADIALFYGRLYTWKGVDLTKIVADAEAFKIAEGGIYADAEAAAMQPINGPAGELRAVARTDSDTGRRTIDFFGQGSFVRQFKQPRRLIAATNLNRRERG